MKLYIFYSIHDQLFSRIANALSRDYGVDAVGGFVWDEVQRETIEKAVPNTSQLKVFTRDILPRLRGVRPDYDYLEACERRYDFPLNKMIFADRHLVTGRPYDEVLYRVELTFRMVEQVLDEEQPDWLFSEEVSCLTSYIHWVVARERGVPFVLLSAGRLPNTIILHGSNMQLVERTEELFDEVRKRGLRPAEQKKAADYLDSFVEGRKNPIFPSIYAKLPVASRTDVSRFWNATRHFLRAPTNPLLTSPPKMIWQRAVRVPRARLAERLFERPVAGEKFVLFPLHLQPEASTLVLAPYYLDQVTLIEDIAKSLPVGHRLYVKEHKVCQGRRPLADYRRIKETYGVRLLGPHEDTWSLIENASAIAVITGTMGWEGLLYGKPVITFGQVFYNSFPLTFRAGAVSRYEWSALFRRAIYEHRPDRELLEQFLYAVLETTYPGLFHHPWTTPQVLDPENVALLARAIADAAGLIDPPQRAAAKG